MLTYQEFQFAVANGRGVAFIGEAIAAHTASAEYKLARTADEYDAQRNVTINQAARYIYSLNGAKTMDFTASNNRIASNFFHRLNNQRCTYSLGNGITFADMNDDVPTETVELDKNRGIVRIPLRQRKTDDSIKAKLGPKFDTDLFVLAGYALKHGVSFGFWAYDRLHVFPLTEFVPLWDEEDGTLRAGIRFWCLDWAKKPVYAVLYEEDGYTKLRTRDGETGLDLRVTDEKRAYRYTVAHTDAGGDEIIDENNYSSLPIVPLYPNRMKQSTLVGMRASIDSYDLIASGFANDLTDTAQIYWILGNAMGMADAEVQRFMDRLRLTHVAVADTDNTSISPYTQEPPYAAREAYLDRISATIYRDFGAFNPEDVAAGNVTATQINAAYQAMDEEADAFEYQIIEFVQQILALQGLEGTPQFKRNRISNLSEQVQMVMMEANYLDDRTVLELLPNISVDKIDEILANRDLAEYNLTETESADEEDIDENLSEYEDDGDVDSMLSDLEKQLDGLFGGD